MPAKRKPQLQFEQCSNSTQQTGKSQLQFKQPRSPKQINKPENKSNDASKCGSKCDIDSETCERSEQLRNVKNPKHSGRDKDSTEFEDISKTVNSRSGNRYCAVNNSKEGIDSKQPSMMNYVTNPRNTRDIGDKENVHTDEISDNEEIVLDSTEDVSSLASSSSEEEDFVFNKHDIYTSSEIESDHEKVDSEQSSKRKTKQTSKIEPEFSPFKNFVPISRQRNPIPIDFKNQFKSKGNVESVVKRSQKRKNTGRKRRKPRKKRKTTAKSKGKKI